MSSYKTATTIYTGGDLGAMSYQEIIPSLEQSIEDWITESTRSESQRAITTYRGIITGFRAHLQGKHLDLDHSPIAVAAVAREWLNARPVSWATFNQSRSILSSFFKYALRNEVEGIQANPIERIRARKPGKKEAAAQALRPSTANEAECVIDENQPGLAHVSFTRAGVRQSSTDHAKRFTDLAVIQRSQFQTSHWTAHH